MLIIVWRGVRKPWRRRRLARQEIPEAWCVWLQDHVPFYGTLDGEARTRFEQDVQFFVDEQTFEALDGLLVTDTLRLGVAAGAALLLHGRPDWELPTNRTILFYPDRFDEDYYDGDYAAYDGMVHAQGPIILSAASIEADWARPGNGQSGRPCSSRAARQEIPEAWCVWLQDHVPFYGTLDGEARTRFEQDVQFFVDEQTFEALDGLLVTDTLRLGVACRC